MNHYTQEQLDKKYDQEQRDNEARRNGRFKSVVKTDDLRPDSSGTPRQRLEEILGLYK